MRRRTAMLTLAVTAALLAGCDPLPPAADGQAWLWVTVDADAHLRAQLVLDSSDRSADEQLAIGRSVAARLVPTSLESVVAIDSNGAGYPYVTIDAPDVYTPGPDVTVSVDTREAVAWLLAQGLGSVDVTIQVPATDGRASWQPDQPGSVRWDWGGVTDGAEAPHGTVRLLPGLAPPLGAVALLLAAIACAVLALRAKRVGRRRDAVLWSCAALVAAFTFTWLDHLGAVIDTLGVRGILHGAAARADAALLPLDLLLPVAAIALVAAAVGTTPRSAAPPSSVPPMQG